LYYEQSGKKEGKPVLCLHGGPGGSSSPFTRTFFDPQVYRIIQFDQRGAGKSTPAASLHDNTTWHLVADIEKLRTFLGIERWWMVFGGSWGSTLSLAYAETHPDRVKSLVIRGIFTVRRSEMLFFYQEGTRWLFPEAHDEFVAEIPESERGDLMSAYYRRLTSTNEEIRLSAARAWTRWEQTVSRLFVNPEAVRRADDPTFAIPFSCIECHYFVHGGFFREDGQLIKEAHRLKNIPTAIVQGRYDVVCPAKTAWDLHKAIPHSEFHIVPDAGHSFLRAGLQ